MNNLTKRMLMWAALLALLMTACSTSTRTSPPEIADIYWPYHGVDANYSVSCEETSELFGYDSNAPLDIQEVSNNASLGLTVTDLTYASPMGGRVPATLVIPNGKGPFAGLLIQHGMGSGSHPGARKFNLAEAEFYARLGAVVIMIDAPFNRPEHAIVSTLYLSEQDRREQIQYIIDLRRAVDLLISRPDVDPQRLAYVGFSGGGALGGLLAGVEHRLQGYVLVVGDGGLVTHVTGPEDFGWWEIKPKGLREQWIAWMWPIEPVHYIHCAAPASLLFQNGTKDLSVPAADALRYQEAGSEPKTVLWYDASHNNLGKDAFIDRVEWLRDLIGISETWTAFLDWGTVTLAAYIILTAGSLAFLAVELWRLRPALLGARFLWLLTVVFLGPLGLVSYWIAARRGANSIDLKAQNLPARRALGSTAWAAAGNLAGATLFLVLVICLQQQLGPHLVLTITAAFVIPFCTGWLSLAGSRWLSRKDNRFLSNYRRPVLAEMTSTCLVLTCVYPILISVIDQFINPRLGPYGYESALVFPLMWGALCLAAMAGTIFAYPFHLWLIRRGVIRWGDSAMNNEDASLPLAGYWQVSTFLLAAAMMLGAFFLSIHIE